MLQIPNWFSSTDDRAEETINEIIDYLHADKKLRDEQFEAILKSFNAAGVVLKDLGDIELENK